MVNKGQSLDAVPKEVVTYLLEWLKFKTWATTNADMVVEKLELSLIAD